MTAKSSPKPSLKRKYELYQIDKYNCVVLDWISSTLRIFIGIIFMNNFPACFSALILTITIACPVAVSQEQKPVDIGSRRELFVDQFLIEKLDKAWLQQGTPRDEGIALKFDKPWEGLFCGYVTIIQDGDVIRAYYRGSPKAGADGNSNESYCCAESKDGKIWTKPELTGFDHEGVKTNRVLANAAPITHNFCPFIDKKPGVPASERYKAIGGTMTSGLIALKSADGLKWEKIRPEPIISKAMVPFPYMFDSQNVPFWSEAENKYLCYFRVFKDGIRRIVRSESDDFINWTKPVLMEYTSGTNKAPIEHLYTNQTSPYFRAPHHYVAISARFMPNRRVLNDEQAKAIKVDPGYFKDTSDAIMMSTRPVEGKAHASIYDRTFLEGFVRGGVGAQNWVSRTNYPALNIIQTGPAEMSFYVNQDYAQPTSHLRRYSLRLDGLGSLHANYQGGEMTSKPFIFNGNALSINFSTSAAGGVLFELQDTTGKAIPGFELKDCQEQIGNEIDRIVTWKKGADLGMLAGKPIKLRISLHDADLYSFKFHKP